MTGRHCTFTANGLRCDAQERDGEWLVTVANVTVARSPDLAQAIREATGGLVAADAASNAASVIRERLQRAG
jgi:hypothetical protein